ncbi:MAG: hypothetical protein ACYC5Y_04230 [Symbiobacteriia bacterium]
MPWQRTYREPYPTGPVAVWSAAAGLLGMELLSAARWAGILALAAAVAAPVALWLLLPRRVLACGPDGFQAVGYGRGHSWAAGPYRWAEVAATTYEEVAIPGLVWVRGRQRTSCFFVELASGQVLHISQRISDFEDLIAVFNAMTPQLPYIWEKAPGRSLPLALQNPSNRIAVYRRAARSEPR